MLGSKAPSAEAAKVLTRHAADDMSAESTLHQALVSDLGGDPTTLALIQASPTTRAYTSYVAATVFGGDFAEGLASIMPCLWPI